MGAFSKIKEKSEKQRKKQLHQSEKLEFYCLYNILYNCIGYSNQFGIFVEIIFPKEVKLFQPLSRVFLIINNNNKMLDYEDVNLCFRFPAQCLYPTFTK